MVLAISYAVAIVVLAVPYVYGLFSMIRDVCRKLEKIRSEKVKT